MRILILGTSNSIIYPGWTFGLRKALPSATIENKSIGASPGIQFSMNLHDTDFSQYDFVFFDSVPNDQTYHDLQLINYEKQNTIFFHKITFEIIKRIASQAKLIVMCIEEQIYFKYNSEFYNNRISFAQNANAYFVNTKLLIKDFVQRNGINPDIIYDYHPSHPDRGIMDVIGQAIGENLPFLQNDQTIPTINITENPFSYWWPTEQYENKQYKNSLVDDNYAVLYNNQSIRFHTSDILIGFYINISKTNCVMDLLLNGNIVFSISLSYPDAGNIVKIFVPIPKILQIDEIIIRPASNTKVDYYALAARKEDFSQENTILTIASFIFCNPDLLDKTPFLFQNSSENNKFQSDKLQRQLEHSFETKQHTKKMFLIKPNTGNDIIDKTSFFDTNVTSKNKRIALFTYHERILCFNTKERRFEPLLLEDIDKPNIYLVNILHTYRDKIFFFINVSNNIFYINPFNIDDNLISYECHHDRILFKKNDLILSARETSKITTISEQWGSFELFLIGCIIN